MPENHSAKKPDIFDKIMHLPVLRIFEPFYKKNKEVLLYLFFGVLTTVVSFVTGILSNKMLLSYGCSEWLATQTSTVISWICAVTFAFVTNRVWVFDSDKHGARAVLAEGASFYGGRLFTLLVEMFMMWLGHTVIGIGYIVTKIIANVVVLVLNYVISKLIVFKKKAETQEE